MTLEEATSRMQAAIEHLRGELAQIRTGRASSALVSDILIDAYDSKLMVKELGQITTPEPHVILISPWDKSIITNKAVKLAKTTRREKSTKSKSCMMNISKRLKLQGSTRKSSFAKFNFAKNCLIVILFNCWFFKPAI